MYHLFFFIFLFKKGSTIKICNKERNIEMEIASLIDVFKFVSLQK